MIKGHPCKVAEITTSKTGKHGHAKAHIVALDIFTSKKYEDLCPTSHNVEVPFVKRTEYQVLMADADTGNVSLLLESGETKDDLNLPDRVAIGELMQTRKPLQICWPPWRKAMIALPLCCPRLESRRLSPSRRLRPSELGCSFSCT